MLPLVIAAVVLCALAGVGVALRRRRARRARPRAAEFGPIPSCVRLLTSEDDLRDAVERAVAHERTVAQRSTARIDRYHRIVDRRPVPLVSGGELLDFDSSSGPRTGGRIVRSANAAARPQPPPDDAA